MDISTECPVSESLSFCLALARTYATLSRQFDGRLGGLHGLSFADFTLMLQLCRAPDGRLRRVDLAQSLGLTASAVTRALIPLEKIGLVSRQTDPHDARVGYATLTKTGRRVLEEAMDSAELISRETISRGAVTDVRSLGKALARLAPP
jgi:DNA-binding MarR family transcriptional regulator